VEGGKRTGDRNARRARAGTRPKGAGAPSHRSQRSESYPAQSPASKTTLQAILHNIPRGSRLLVAVSGGVDSVCLLAGLVRLATARAYYIEAAHVDHAARAGSGDDALFVEALCAQLGVRECHLRRLALVPTGMNREAWWRHERYRFFGEVAAQRSLEFVVTAHHRNDLVETVLSRFIMNREVNGPEHEGGEGRLCPPPIRRPFLTVPKETLVAAATEWVVPWREDPTNTEVTYTRNRVRHLLIPYLSQEFGVTVDALAEQSSRLSEDAQFLWSLSADRLVPLDRMEPGGSSWTRELRALVSDAPSALQWRIASLALLSLVGYPLGPRHGARFVRFLLGSRREFQCAGGIAIVRYQGGLIRTARR
jgi:tRNA(Ile)-lysidine synthetase-like protein